MHICFVAGSFPRGKEAFYTFVKAYVDSFADKGIRCSVISPQSVTKVIVRGRKLRPVQWHYMTSNGNRVDVYQPIYFSWSNFLRKRMIKNIKNAIKRTLCSFDAPVDLFYAHFWFMGLLMAGISDGKPVFVTCGEGSEISAIHDYEKQELEEVLQNISGVVHVSSKTLDETRAAGIQKDIPYVIAPNGYNPRVFYKKDKLEIRRKLGYPENSFIVAFLGSFDERKGSCRLSEALDALNQKLPEGENIHSIFIGRGKCKPDCDNILHCGPLSHDAVPDYLNAADIFVLPTNNEGCCNAIVEALACHLPIVSSDKKFNDEILDETCSIRINEMSVPEIQDTIEKLYRDRELTARLAAGAAEKAESLTIWERVDKITAFMNDVLKK